MVSLPNENDYHERIYRSSFTFCIHYCRIFICDCRLHLLNFFAIITLHLLGNKIMTDVNYTPAMVATLEAAQPIDYAKAQLLAKQLDRGVRSIIAKTKREGFDYISKPAPAKKKAAPTKGDMVAAICAALDMDSCEGLEKSTGSALNKLMQNIA